MCRIFVPYSFKSRLNRVLNLSAAIDRVYSCNCAGVDPSMKELYICAFLLLWPFRRFWL